MPDIGPRPKETGGGGAGVGKNSTKHADEFRRQWLKCMEVLAKGDPESPRSAAEWKAWNALWTAESCALGERALTFGEKGSGDVSNPTSSSDEVKTVKIEKQEERLRTLEVFLEEQKKIFGSREGAIDFAPSVGR